jgi:hypothetical protein
MIESVFVANRASIIANVLHAPVRTTPAPEPTPSAANNDPAASLHHPRKIHPSALLIILRNSTGGP